MHFNPVVLPEEMVLNYLFGVYINRLYPQNPVTVKTELLREVQAGLLPDYCFASILLFASRWDSELLNLVGPSRRAQIMHGLFSTAISTLMPALEVALAGYHSMVDPQIANEEADPISLGPPKNSRESYLRTVAYCIIALFHLMTIAIAYPHPGGPQGGQFPPSEDDTSFESFRSILSLIIRVTKVSLILDPRISARRVPAMLQPESGLIETLKGSDYFSVWLERVKRVWAGCVAQDNFFSAMYGTEPLISWEDCRWMRGFLVEDEFDRAKALFERQVKETHELGWLMVEGAVLPETADYVLDPAPKPVFIPGSSDVILTAPLRTISKINGAQGFGVRLALGMRLGQLASLVGKYRRFVKDRPYTGRAGKRHLEQQLRHFVSEMPPPFPDGVVRLLEAEKDNFSSPKAIAAGAAAYFLLQYHAILTTLSSPSDSVFFSGELEWNWVVDDAFITAQEHAILATQLIVPFVENKTTLPQMCLPFFQWCVVRTGLIHFYFLRWLLHDATSASGDLDAAPPDNNKLLTIETTRTQLMIHDSALRKAQGGIGFGERRSWWFEVWRATTGMS